jgi:drug/metabolite transporter (DMT)-like permease
MDRKFRAHLFLMIVNLFYGAGFSVTKLVMPQFIQPFGFILIRVSVTGLLFLVIQRVVIKENIQLKHLPLFMASALFGVVINQEMFFLGLEQTTPINAALIMITTPILVFVISFFMKYEKATWQKVLGLFFGAGGALLIMSGKGFSFSSSTLVGDLFILLNATSYAVYLVIVRPLMKQYHPLTVVTYVFLFGLLPVFVFGFNQFAAIDWNCFTITAWGGLIFIVVCTTFFAYLLNMLALREVSSSVVGAYIYLQPVLASIIAILLNQDVISTEKIIAASSIFLGVSLVSFSRSSVLKIAAKK